MIQTTTSISTSPDHQRTLTSLTRFLLAGWFPIICVLSFGIEVTGLISTDSRTTNQTRAVHFGLLCLFTLLFLGGLAIKNSHHNPKIGLIAQRLASDQASRHLLTRWLTRTGWFRSIGGLSGGLFYVFCIPVFSSDLSYLLLFGMTGVLLGAICAETYQVRGSAGPRVVSLKSRSVNDYLTRRQQRRTIALSATWVVVAVVSSAVPGRLQTLPLALTALGLLGFVRLFQHRVANRPRISLPSDLERADDLVRELAITRSLGQPSNIVALVLLLPAAGVFDQSFVDGQLQAVSYVIFLLAGWWWLNNLRFGLDWLADDSQGTPAKKAGTSPPGPNVQPAKDIDDKNPKEPDDTPSNSA